MIKHINITVKGRVQGVLFRYSAKIEADKLNLKGFVKNTEDGSVYIEAEGPEADLKILANWCKSGPKLAQVDDVKIEMGEMKNFTTFESL